MPVSLDDSIAVVSVQSSSDSWLEAWNTSADLAYCRSATGALLAVNLTFARKFGRSLEGLAGEAITNFVHPDDITVFNTAEAELARPPHRATREHRWVTPQGIRWFSWDETALRDDSGALMAIRAVGRDITRQRLAEEQFYRLSRAVEQSPVSVVITDLDGGVQYVNSKFTAVSGLTLEDLLDRPTDVLRDGHPDDDSYQKFLTTIRSGGEWRGEFATRRQDGGVVWESVKVSCLRSPAGEITNFLCLREDITERKKLEGELRQAHKMESLGTLAGGIAHDFNNLLAIISGYAELGMQGNQTPESFQSSLREIHTAADRAVVLVQQILAFSRKAEVRFTPVDINRLGRDLVALLAATFPRTIVFKLALQDKLPPLLADQSQLQQIVLNLCVNARDAMPSGGTIQISTSAQPGSRLLRLGANPRRNYACFQVADTGTGMTPEVRARIFEPFFTTKQSNRGTGLGLAVAYGIVVAHHGFIDVTSAPGAGSTFSVYLPLAENAVIPAPPVTDQEFPGGDESLLIVDDEEALRDLLATALTRKGYRTTMAGTGLEAMDVINDPTLQFDLALVDLNMPGATGVEVLKRIRSRRPELKVLIISGHITAQARAECETLGRCHFVQKPYTLDSIGRALRRLIESPTGE